MWINVWFVFIASIQIRKQGVTIMKENTVVINENRIEQNGVIFLFNQVDGELDCCDQCDANALRTNITGVCHRAACMSQLRTDGKEGNFKISREQQK